MTQSTVLRRLYYVVRWIDLHNIPHGKEQAVKLLEDALNLAEEINYDEIEAFEPYRRAMVKRMNAV